ncbi:hydantoinase/oxoprolinase family protein [Paenibacillus urinalis]|uniref:Hydantoinase/oxoprolinase family protein n=1 Tax=Paenibacillus urinalis TaxID=521520 RepID=A0AAX3N4G3_9BACL|nr:MULTISPECIES: hydantoinase/oxoprolinase family protein [Paenibacillus]WDH83512.1 hydantoinase/oxoprolinase family protein [Paenibacillus urinalis]WDH99550.1 hydantoinase/oxoprolinase family protein [Paenibacillus urinalis]WDI03182.1 hydantoinase/oxoprolinase family protein [Paenibacillus urinalis]GAK41890.1 hydantoinase/oxoprolinase [Paenibacillus sp. TCA20]
MTVNRESQLSSMESYRIGIDVGGTNTDAALLDSKLNTIHTVKVHTTKDVNEGIVEAVRKLLEESTVNPALIKFAMLGTTHCTNAIVERKNLGKVGLIRIGAPAATTIPPLTGWDQTLASVIGDHAYMAKGGYEYDGRTIVDMDEEEIRNLCERMKGEVASVAVCGIFSPVNTSQERRAAEIVREVLGEDMVVTLSHEIGSIGLLERENASILNGALLGVISGVVQGFEAALESFGIQAGVYICQNDGTLMRSDYALRYPILTIACGPTNSIRGAAHLSGLSDALVVDIGGTTTDIGVLSQGFPRQSSAAVTLGGVRTNFRMPDILSIGIGGGTIIRTQASSDGESRGVVTVGPDSVGYELTKRGTIFGGDTLTATDVVVKLGRTHWEGAQIERIDEEICLQADEIIKTDIEDAIDRMKSSSAPVDVILVGGGSILVPEELEGVARIIRPAYYGAANAIGAALGEVSGETERIYSLEELTYDEVMEDARSHAVEQAVRAGADRDTVQIVFTEDIPLAYLPGNALLVKVKAAGRL